MAWQPPTPEQFKKWPLPGGLLKAHASFWDTGSERRAIIEKLKAGAIIAVAETAQIKGSSSLRGHYQIPASAWRDLQTDDEFHFWTQRQLIVEDDDSLGADRYFDIRLDPETVAGRATVAETPLPEAPQEAPPAEREKDLSGAEAERFAVAIVAGWPDCTRQFAREKALLFFPEHKVPRDWFYEIFRSIQGHKNPGKQPKKRL